MVATQNIDTLSPIWTFSLRGVLTFVATVLHINGCATTLHCRNGEFLQCCYKKIYNKIFTKMLVEYIYNKTTRSNKKNRES